MRSIARGIWTPVLAMGIVTLLMSVLTLGVPYVGAHIVDSTSSLGLLALAGLLLAVVTAACLLATCLLAGFALLKRWRSAV